MLARFFMLTLCVITLTAWGCSTSTGARKTAKDPKVEEAGRIFTLGLNAMNHEEWDKAENYFLEVLKIKPQSYGTRLYLAKVYDKEGNKEKEVGELREAIKLNNEDSSAYSLLMDCYDESGQTDKEIAAGEEALLNGAGSDGILIKLGWSYYVSGDYDKAEERLKAAKENSKKDFMIPNDMGLVNFSRGRYEDALSDFKEADRLNPKSRYVPYFLALTYKKLGSDDEALGALVAGFKKDPQLESKVKEYNKQYFPRTDPGDLSALFGKARAEAGSRK